MVDITTGAMTTDMSDFFASCATMDGTNGCANYIAVEGSDFDDGATIGFTFADVAEGGNLDDQDFSAATEQFLWACNDYYAYCIGATFGAPNKVAILINIVEDAAITEDTAPMDLFFAGTKQASERYSYENGYWGWENGYGIGPYDAVSGWVSEGEDLAWIRFIKNSPDAPVNADGDKNVWWAIDNTGAYKSASGAEDSAVTIVAAGATMLIATVL